MPIIPQLIGHGKQGLLELKHELPFQILTWKDTELITPSRISRSDGKRDLVVSSKIIILSNWKVIFGSIYSDKAVVKIWFATDYVIRIDEKVCTNHMLEHEKREKVPNIIRK